MIRNLLIVLGLLLCFAVGGVGIYHCMSSQGATPFFNASAADLVGTWQNKALSLKIEAHGEALTVDQAEYLRDGKAPRWVEKSPQGQIPRVLEWNGAQLTVTSTDDNGQRRSEILKKQEARDRMN